MVDALEKTEEWAAGYRQRETGGEQAFSRENVADVDATVAQNNAALAQFGQLMGGVSLSA